MKEAGSALPASKPEQKSVGGASAAVTPETAPKSWTAPAPAVGAHVAHTTAAAITIAVASAITISRTNVEALGDTLPTAEFGDGNLATQAIEDDADLFLS